MTDPVWFVLTALGLLIAPGPTNALLANIGADNNARRLPALLAMLLGYAITISIVGFALAPLLRAQPWLGTALKLTSSAYLLTLAVRLWRRPQHGESNVNSISWRQVFTTTLLNPKGLVFALAVIPFGNPMVAEYLGVFAVLVLIAGAVWLLAGRLLRRVTGADKAIVPRVTAAVLACFAAVITATAFG